LKPVPPEPYDGRPHLPALHQFMSQVGMWVEDASIPPNRQVYRTSRYLLKKAYDWYAREVAPNVERWTLDKFFYAMYDHCFPVDYKERAQARLERFEQRDLSVKEYV
ncbi:hypothetical protein FA13DRAFT_1602301, partial [Coprinellus micaceus]